MDNTEYETITEGLASMNYSKGEEVFYNKVQVLNRDLSIQVIKLFAEIRQQERNAVYEKKMLRYNAEVAKATNKADVKVPFKCFDGITVLDALAATGLRSVRYLKEIPGVNHVTINDLLPAATKAAAVNVERNGIDTSRVTINTGDACLFMYGHKEPLKQFDVIDLDPYGTAACFLDSAVQAVSDGGLLCVTCTDMSVFCGNYPEKCFALYGGVPLKAKYGHEMALRILLHTIDTTANKYKRHIEPWVSMSIDYYIRVFVRVHESPVEVKKSMCKRAMVHQSNLCSSYYLQPMGSMTMKKKELLYSPSVVTAPSTCPETGGRMKIGGPIWSYPIHKTDVLKELIGRLSCMVDTKSSTPAETIQVESCTASDVVVVPPAATAVRLLGLLTAMDEELADVPLHYYLPDMASQVHSKVPNMSLIHTALQNAGYRCSQFHHVPEALKTDAPPTVVWDVMRAYCKANPPSGSKHKQTSAAAEQILCKEPSIDVNFESSTAEGEGASSGDAATTSTHKRNRDGIKRFPPNPEANWGPKRRAGALGKLLVKNSGSTDTSEGSSVKDSGDSSGQITDK